MQEREIDLLDLITDILSRWRGLLICMLVGAALMGGGSLVKSVQESMRTEVPAISEETGEAVEKPDLPAAKPSVSMKLVLAGAFLAAFAYAGIFFVLYLMNDRLRASDELQKLYHISQLGLIVKEAEGNGKRKDGREAEGSGKGKDGREAEGSRKGKDGREAEGSRKKKDGRVRKMCKGLGLWIDRQIEAMRNRGKRRFDREQSLELAAAAVKLLVYKHGINNICLMGCELKAGADTAVLELKERLEKEDITVTVLDNVLYDAGTMEELKNVRGVVLVEKAMSTMYEEVLRELELIARQGIIVLGGIIVA